jgi:hypothetical protein
MCNLPLTSPAGVRRSAQKLFVAKHENEDFDVLQIIMHCILLRKIIIRRPRIINKGFSNPIFSLKFTSYISVSVRCPYVCIIMTFKPPRVFAKSLTGRAHLLKCEI